MKVEDIIGHVDHTLLKAAASWEEIRKLCDEAVKYQTASVCVPSSYVKKIRENYPRLTICTVVGFPLGNGNSESKAEETIHALDDGADEIDMVINVGWIKSNQWAAIKEDIQAVLTACQGKPLKVILETCLLTKEEIVKACEISKTLGVAFVKTSTGFNRGGATVEDVALMKQVVGDMGVKASGGIRDTQTALAMIEAGATRIGASAGIAIVKGIKDNNSDY